MIYTKRGDGGHTYLANKDRVDKCDVRIQALGDVDELNAFIGLLIANCCWVDVKQTKFFNALQSDLFVIGAHLCKSDINLDMELDRIAYFEEMIDDLTSTLPPLHNFILPAGNMMAANIHLARAICRRVERSIVALHRVEKIDERVIIYLNRLSDLLFMLARKANKMGAADILWSKNSEDK